MPAQSIIDSHVHLWPESMANETGHAWMTPEMPLAKQHLLTDYHEASRQDENTHVEGIVYIETDVRHDESVSDITAWTQGPQDEIHFLRSIVEDDRNSNQLLGIVLWAPMDQPPSVLEAWLTLAETIAGPATWSRVKGFRYLLQSIQDVKAFEMLVFSSDFIANLQILGRRGFSFDVGVDQRSGGTWQLEAINKAMGLAHEGFAEEERVTFIVNHLCKPAFDLESEHWPAWRRAVEDMSRHDRTYMKLSGAFSELPEGLEDVESIAKHIRPWFRHVLECFGIGRIMFGSDWPVCNVRGPRGEQSWTAWRHVVEALLGDEELSLTADAKDEIYRATAKEAYRL